MATVKTVIGEVRFSYLHVFAPWSATESDAKNYTATLLIKKSDTALVEQVKKAIADAYANASTEKWGGKKPAKWFNPLQDGDEPKADGEDRGPAYHGCYYINAKSRIQPGVVGRDRQTIMNEEEFYSGCYGYAAVAFSGFINSGNMGISCFLNNLMKSRDGEPLGGARTDAASDFAGIQLDDEDWI